MIHSLASPARLLRRRGAPSPRITSHEVATGLGWLSVGLGLAELLAPRAVSRAIGDGIRGRPLLVRALGAREIISAAGIILGKRKRQAPWVWSRFAGDAMDMALLGAGVLMGTRGKRPATRLLATAGSVAGLAAIDWLCARRLSAASEPAGLDRADREVTRWTKSILLSKSPEEVYAFWRQFENLPRFMSRLESVEDLGEGRSHWVAATPMGGRLEWDAEVTQDIPSRRITWRTLEHADLHHTGAVHFESAPGNRGTRVVLELEVLPGACSAASMMAKWLGNMPEKALYGDLLRLRQLMETGELSRTEGQSAGPRSALRRLASTVAR